MICASLSATLLFAYYILIVSRHPALRLTDKLLLPFTLTCGQIILTEELLGICSQLTATLLLLTNIAIAAVLLFIATAKSSRRGLLEICKGDLAALKAFLQSTASAANITLLGVLLISYGWVLLADYLLPLRGVDDLYYHLPPIFQYIQTHSITLLPIEIRHHFAFPQNAELLFMWPLVFSPSLRMLDAANVPFIMISIVAIYGLLRRVPISRKDAVFVSLLYPMTPVVIMQAGSNYIDIIVVCFFLISLHYTVQYLEERRTICLLAAGLATGVVCGMKYTALFLTIPLQLIILWRAFTFRKKDLLIYLPAVLALSGWWYLRNGLELGNPFYPMNPFSSGMGVMSGGQKGPFFDILANASHWIHDFPFADIGLGSYDGGFGLVFWGFGFPAWLLLCAYSLKNFRKVRLSRILILLQLPLGFCLLLALPGDQLVYCARLALLVVPIGLFAFAVLLKMIDDRGYNTLLKIFCIVFSILAASLMTQATMPLLRVESVLADQKNDRHPSAYKYVKDANPVYATLRAIWEPLDYLTRDDRPGLNCYVAADRSLVALAPLYGSNLQNRLVNIEQDTKTRPDALIYIAYPDRSIFGKLVKEDLRYYGYELRQREALRTHDYVVVTHSEYGSLLISAEYCRRAEKQALLRTYYRETWPEEVAAAILLKEHLNPEITLITANPVIYGLRSLDSRDNFLERMILVPRGEEEVAAKSRNLQECYTLDAPLPGFAAQQVASLTINSRTMILYRNQGGKDAGI